MAIEVYTWKSNSKGRGLSKPVKSMLLGGNVGHAAIELTFPADDKGDELARKYQDVPGLAISKRTEIIPEKQENGTYKPKQQVSYFVYFSWWPGHTNGHHINSYQDDLDAEWRHEPSTKMKAHVHAHLYGEEVPEKNKTQVTGVLVRKKTITKLKEIAHPSLVKAIEQDLAYQELNTERTALKDELLYLQARLNAYAQEEIAAQREHREPNKELDLNETENTRFLEINKDIRRINAQIKRCAIDFKERHLSLGQPPLSTYRMATVHDHHAPAFALDTERILDKMAEFAQSNSAYSFYKLNCSTTATAVLKAGINEHLKSSLDANGFKVDEHSKAAISTPTSFRHFSQRLQAELTHINTKHYVEERQEQADSTEEADFKSRFKTQQAATAIKQPGDELDSSMNQQMGI